MLVDTNILIYAINTTSPKRRAAQQFFQKEKRNLFLAHQNICEALRVLTHPKLPNPMSQREAMMAVSSISSAVSMVWPDYGTLEIALALIAKYRLTADHVFDAYLAGTALTHGITEVATDNERDFGVFEEITVFNPLVARGN